MNKLKLVPLSDDFLLFTERHIIYIDSINKQYRIATTPHNPIVLNFGDIFTYCYNNLQSFKDVEDDYIQYSLVSDLKYIDLNDMITCVNSKTLSSTLKRFIKSNTKPLNFQLGVFKDKPIYYCDCVLTDLLLFDLVSLINDKRIDLKICDKCQRLFKRTRHKQAWCDECLSNDESRKAYHKHYYDKHIKGDSIKDALKKTTGRIYRRYQARPDMVGYGDLNNPYKQFIDRIVKTNNLTLEDIYKLSSLDFIQQHLIPIYSLYKRDNGEVITIEMLYNDMIKSSTDIQSLEAWVLGLVKKLPQRERNILTDKLSLHVLKNKRTSEANKQALINELDKLKLIVDSSGKDKR